MIMTCTLCLLALKHSPSKRKLAARTRATSVADGPAAHGGIEGLAAGPSQESGKRSLQKYCI